MSDNEVITEIESLVQQWRKRADESRNEHMDLLLEECADELEDALGNVTDEYVVVPKDKINGLMEELDERQRELQSGTIGYQRLTAKYMALNWVLNHDD